MGAQQPLTAAEPARRLARRLAALAAAITPLCLAGSAGLGAAAAQSATVGAASAAAATGPSSSASAGNTWLGINLEYVTSWSSELPFVDVLKEATPWVSNAAGVAWGQGGPLAEDADGWITSLSPGQYADAMMLGVQGHYPAGLYTLLYDGQGSLRFASGSVSVVSQSAGRWVVSVAGGGGAIDLRETATNPADHLRNIRFIMPGFEATSATQPFNPTFLSRIAPFSTVRFLNWLETDYPLPMSGSQLQWSDRPLPGDAFQTSIGSGTRGVALESMIQLANTLHVNPWFNIYHTASDDYVRQFATVVHDQLDPTLTPYVEYSNETWNGVFAQSQYVENQGLALNLSSNAFKAGELYTGYRAAQVFSIWQSVFASPQRFVRVLASQFDNPWTASQVIAGAGARNADALAVAPYWDCVHGLLSTAAGAAQLEAMTDAQVLADCRSDIEGHIAQTTASNLGIARSNGLRLVGYEGGQNLVGVGPELHDATLAAKLEEVNRQPGMHDAYAVFLSQWHQQVGDLLEAFASCALPSTNGSWGALEWQDQDPITAPKYRALVEAAAGTSS